MTTATQAPAKRGRSLFLGFIAVLLAFGAGFGWQFYEASLVRDQLSATQQELLVERLRVRLGQAAMAAQNGDYETARVRMSDFFTRLDEAQLQLPGGIENVADEFLAMRDEVITGLSRSNPEFAGVLYGMLERFRTAAGLEAGLTPRPMEEAPAEPPTQEMEEGATPDTGAMGGTEAEAEGGGTP